MSTLVYVKGIAGNTLYPTKRCGHVRWLLKNGLAKVVQMKPFQIQLLYKEKNLYETPDHMGTILGIDPGRQNIGVSVITKGGDELYSAKIETRNCEIPELMKKRALNRSHRRQYRRQMRRRRARKCGTVTNFPNGRKLPGCMKPVYPKDIVNSEARFMNRKRKVGWITPTVRQLIQTHSNLIKMISALLPIGSIAFELNKFAFMQMDDGTCRGVDFQNGRLRGYEDKYEYINSRQNYTCCLCGKNPIEHYHHLVKVSEGGSNLPENLIGVCIKCHEKIHKGQLKTKMNGIKKKYHHLSVLNTAIPFIIREIEIKNNNLFLCTGYETSNYRNIHGIIKDHNKDAACIAAMSCCLPFLQFQDTVYTIRQFRCHNRQIIHCKKERTYYYQGKAVAKNRKNRFEQKGDSLQSWLKKMKLSEEEKEKIVSSFRPIKAKSHKNKTGVVKSIRIRNKRDRILPGASFLYKKERFVLTGTRQKTYFDAVGYTGKKINKSECKIIQKNNGLVYI